jgi:hypothetical protein
MGRLTESIGAVFLVNERAKQVINFAARTAPKGCVAEGSQELIGFRIYVATIVTAGSDN